MNTASQAVGIVKALPTFANRGSSCPPLLLLFLHLLLLQDEMT